LLEGGVGLFAGKVGGGFTVGVLFGTGTVLTGGVVDGGLVTGGGFTTGAAAGPAQAPANSVIKAIPAATIAVFILPLLFDKL
jgi:hypothetical protein